MRKCTSPFKSTGVRGRWAAVSKDGVAEEEEEEAAATGRKAAGQMGRGWAAGRVGRGVTFSSSRQNPGKTNKP